MEYLELTTVSILSVFCSKHEKTALERTVSKINKCRRDLRCDRVWLRGVFLGGFGESGECFRLIGGDVGQDFAVQFNTGFFNTVHETGISKAVQAGTSVDPLDPKRTELTFFQLTADIGILTSLFDGLVRNAECILTTAAITFGLIDNFFVAGGFGNAAFDA